MGGREERRQKGEEMEEDRRRGRWNPVLLSEIHFGKCFGKIFLKCQENVELEKLTWGETKKKKVNRNQKKILSSRKMKKDQPLTIRNSFL